MFRFIYTKLFPSQKRNFLNVDSTKTTFLCLLDYPSHHSTVRSISIANPTVNYDPFVVSYLTSSCGLSLEKAISASKKVQFKSPDRPDSVLSLFRNYEIPSIYISKIIEKNPTLLTYNAELLGPKLEYLKSLHLSSHDLAKIISNHPLILTSSLKKTITPSITFLKTITQSDEDIGHLLKRGAGIIQSSPEKYLIPKISFLQDQGVPNSKILLLLKSQPRVFVCAFDKFKGIVEEVKDMGFDQTKSVFVRAIRSRSAMTKKAKEAKFDAYKKWGWSKDNIHSAFRIQPPILNISVESLGRKMVFLVKKMGFHPLQLVKDPVVLCLSLEKRIIPRFLVIQILISNGLVENDGKWRRASTLLLCSDKVFLEKYVTKFEQRFPELLNAFQGKTETLEQYCNI